MGAAGGAVAVGFPSPQHAMQKPLSNKQLYIH
jgi:hypothetical protein